MAPVDTGGHGKRRERASTNGAGTCGRRKAVTGCRALTMCCIACLETDIASQPEEMMCGLKSSHTLTPRATLQCPVFWLHPSLMSCLVHKPHTSVKPAVDSTAFSDLTDSREKLFSQSQGHAFGGFSASCLFSFSPSDSCWHSLCFSVVWTGFDPLPRPLAVPEFHRSGRYCCILCGLCEYLLFLG